MEARKEGILALIPSTVGRYGNIHFLANKEHCKEVYDLVSKWNRHK